MINISSNRKKYIVTATVPSGTTDISYTVSIGGNLVFLGKTKYFGGNYEVDCSDWIDNYLYNHRNSMAIILLVTVTVVFTYDNSTTETKTCTWQTDTINLVAADLNTYSSCAILVINASCGYNMLGYGQSDVRSEVRIPLSIKNGILEGKTINKLDKTTYIDKYGDSHNGSVTNHYELECYIDPCWLQVETGKDIDYEKLMLAMQNSLHSYLTIKNISISGMTKATSSTETINVHIKDVEKIETYSSYSTEKKVPTYKITLEVFNS